MASLFYSHAHCLLSSSHFVLSPSVPVILQPHRHRRRPSSSSRLLQSSSRLRRRPTVPLSLRCLAIPSLGMETTPSQVIYPLHRCKTIHLVRHAQGIHNVEGEKNHEAYFSEELFDARLTPLGWQQVDNLRKHVKANGLSRRIDLVIVSPLLRTLQTAVGVFGDDDYIDAADVPPLMVADAGNSDRPAIASLNCPPFVAVELCREHLGVDPCDRRSNICKYRELFPAVDFSLIETDEDVLWKREIREKNEEVAARGMKFLNWFCTRKEKEIAVVTHSGFLYHTLNSFGNDCEPAVKEETSTHFANCELRSMVLVDRWMVGSDLATTNYPGKIPSGQDLSSDVTDDNCVQKDSA